MSGTEVFEYVKSCCDAAGFSLYNTFENVNIPAGKPLCFFSETASSLFRSFLSTDGTKRKNIVKTDYQLTLDCAEGFREKFSELFAELSKDPSLTGVSRGEICLSKVNRLPETKITFSAFEKSEEAYAPSLSETVFRGLGITAVLTSFRHGAETKLNRVTLAEGELYEGVPIPYPNTVTVKTAAGIEDSETLIQALHDANGVKQNAMFLGESGIYQFTPVQSGVEKKDFFTVEAWFTAVIA